jgi:hypothetical protein
MKASKQLYQSEFFFKLLRFMFVCLETSVHLWIPFNFWHSFLLLLTPYWRFNINLWYHQIRVLMNRNTNTWAYIQYEIKFSFQDVFIDIFTMVAMINLFDSLRCLAVHFFCNISPVDTRANAILIHNMHTRFYRTAQRYFPKSSILHPSCYIKRT